jgi:hypothetical protein
MTELARRSVGDGIWDPVQTMPPPGQTLTLHAQAVDRGGNILAEDVLRVERPAVVMHVQPSGQIETDADMVTVAARIATGADWIRTIVVRDETSSQTVMAESAVAKGTADLKIAMPAPGASSSVTLAAIGRDGKPYATTQIKLARPAPEPVQLLVTSPDGFEVDALTTRLNVEVLNRAQTAVIAVSDARTDQTLERVRLDSSEWLGEINMPEPGQSRELVVEAQDTAGQTLASSKIRLFRPEAAGLAVPLWVWAAGIALGGLGLGLLGGRVRRSGTDGGVSPEPVPPPRLQVFAEPDEKPDFAMAPIAPPSFAIRIDEDDTPEVEIEFDEDHTNPTRSHSDD